VDALDETIKEIRSAIFALHSHREAGHRSLRSQILSIAEEMAGALGFAPSLRFGGGLDEEVPAEIGEHLLYALREALSNAARHSGASRVDVAVTTGADLVLQVRDDGSGISDTARRSGLRNLAERAAQLGGTLKVMAVDDEGTDLRWIVPLPVTSPLPG
jgi:signal transduction histidine kinase